MLHNLPSREQGDGEVTTSTKAGGGPLLPPSSCCSSTTNTTQNSFPEFFERMSNRHHRRASLQHSVPEMMGEHCVYGRRESDDHCLRQFQPLGCSLLEEGIQPTSHQLPPTHSSHRHSLHSQLITEFRSKQSQGDVMGQMAYNHHHRRSQPSLFSASGAMGLQHHIYGIIGQANGQIRQMPSQPTLLSGSSSSLHHQPPLSAARRTLPSTNFSSNNTLVQSPDGHTPRSSSICSMSNPGVIPPSALVNHRHHYSPRSPQSGSPTVGRKVAPSEKRILKRCNQSDLGCRFQRYHSTVANNSNQISSNPIPNSFQFNNEHQQSPSSLLFGSGERGNSNESTPSRNEEAEIDPIYLALKQATGKYGGSSSNGGSGQGSRRGSSAHNFPIGVLGSDSATPSPKNLSQVSLQDSGYAEASGSRHQLNLGSTPQLDQLSSRAQHNSGNGPNGFVALPNNPGIQAGPIGAANRSTGNSNRRPKLSEKMKSLSLDCAEMPPPVGNSMAMRSPFKSKPIRSARGFAASGESLGEWERSVSPTGPAPAVSRRLPLPAVNGTHVVIHEFVTNSVESALFLGDRLHIVDNGDPDWLHGFKVNDRLEQLLTFPSTCVTAIQPGEQPMKLIQNCNLTEKKVRLYRDQVVFAQPDSIRDDSTILIRNEHRTFVYCPIQYLMLLN